MVDVFTNEWHARRDALASEVAELVARFAEAHDAEEV